MKQVKKVMGRKGVFFLDCEGRECRSPGLLYAGDMTEEDMKAL